MSGGDGEPVQQRPKDSESMATPEAAADRLHSWKEIAVYLNRDVRTVRRWEKNQGLPVHRHLHQKSASVYAYRSELNLWWEGERKRLAEAGGEKEAAPSPAPTPISSRSRRKPLWIAAAGVALVGLAVLAILLGRRSGPKPVPGSGRVMLVVLPFQNLTGDLKQEYVSDGFTEEMITELGGLRSANLGVIARTSSMVYKNSNKPISEIGRELGVQYVLEGSVRRWGDRVRVTAQLIQTRDQTHLWAQDFESDRRDVLRLQSEISRAIAEQIRLKLPGHDEGEAEHLQPLDPQVHELCLLGLYQASQRNEAGLTKALGYFQQAVAKDPGYAPAYAGLSEAYLVSAFYSRGSATELYERARSAAQRAVSLNDGTFQAHATLGLVKSSYLEPGAEAEFRRALDLNPSYATAHHWYAFELWRSGRQEDALGELERARELDPVSPIIYTDDAVFHLAAGQEEEAIRLLRKSLDLDPQFSEAHRTLAIAYVRQTRLPAALDEAREALKENPNNIGAEATLAYVEARNGNREAAEATLRRLQASHAPPFFQAWVYVGLGKYGDAVRCLEEEYRSHSPLMVAIAVEPIFAPLQQDARFHELMRRISGGSKG